MKFGNQFHGTHMFKSEGQTCKNCNFQIKRSYSVCKEIKKPFVALLKINGNKLKIRQYTITSLSYLLVSSKSKLVDVKWLFEG